MAHLRPPKGAQVGGCPSRRAGSPPDRFQGASGSRP